MLPRRTFLRLSAGIGVLTAVSHRAKAQPYPARPVRLIIGFAAGGTTDIAARLMGQWLSERLGQQFLIENRTGAGTNIATEAVVRAPADGYTLLGVTASNAINATLYDKLGFDFLRDITPVAGVIRYPLIMQVNPSFPARNIPEFISYAKANRGRISYGSGGSGTSIHVATELFKMMTGVEMTHVPYRGGAPAMTDLIGGQIHVVFNPLPESMDHVRAGRLRPLGVTSAARSPILPDVPTVGEFVPGYEADAVQGIGVPRGTPAEIIDRLNKEVNAGLADPKLKARFADLGATVFPCSPAEFGTFMADETEKWAKVIRFSGAKSE
ncbi:MAG: MFS transporter [Proteobacteria bacterium]|nr:MAG: MFS transporter [Pseudomonadota bacterium]